MPAPKLLTLPPAIAESWDWQLHAACRDADAATFFHPDNERGEARTDRVRAAKRICQSCPVRTQCLRHALEAGERHGIWGGFSEEERRVLVRPSNRAPHSLEPCPVAVSPRSARVSATPGRSVSA
ncbi:WhiB family transcriptional regulator [Rhodococcus sp. 2H158]|nr:WhiB family transcriptional regulator [Rhodococcus rhodochrous]